MSVLAVSTSDEILSNSPINTALASVIPWLIASKSVSRVSYKSDANSSMWLLRSTLNCVILFFKVVSFSVIVLLSVVRSSLIVSSLVFTSVNLSKISLDCSSSTFSISSTIVLVESDIWVDKSSTPVVKLSVEVVICSDNLVKFSLRSSLLSSFVFDKYSSNLVEKSLIFLIVSSYCVLLSDFRVSNSEEIEFNLATKSSYFFCASAVWPSFTKLITSVRVSLADVILFCNSFVSTVKVFIVVFISWDKLSKLVSIVSSCLTTIVLIPFIVSLLEFTLTLTVSNCVAISVKSADICLLVLSSSAIAIARWFQIEKPIIAISKDKITTGITTFTVERLSLFFCMIISPNKFCLYFYRQK